MSSTPESQEARVKAILDGLANAARHVVPEQALTDAHDCREAITPHLCQAVTQANALSASGRLQAEGDWRLPCFALHLLAAWRVPGTYDLILKSLMLKDRYDSRWLMSEAYTEWPHLLLTTFDGDVDRLFRILWQEDPPWNSDLRQCCLNVLTGAHHHGLGDRAAIEAGFEKTLAVSEDGLIQDLLMLHIARLRLMNLIPKVREILESEYREKGVAWWEVEEMLDVPWSLDFKDPSAGPNPIVRPREDLLAIIRGWHYFQPPVELSLDTPLMKEMWEFENAVHDATSRVGPFILPKRTLPCRCGSGLPFGACCAWR